MRPTIRYTISDQWNLEFTKVLFGLPVMYYATHYSLYYIRSVKPTIYQGSFWITSYVLCDSLFVILYQISETYTLPRNITEDTI